MIRRGMFVVAALTGLFATSAVSAEPRDSVDRGERLDTNALRDDVRTNRLQVPSHPLNIAPPQQPASASTKKSKSGANSRTSR